MDFSFLFQILFMLLILPFIIFLIYISLKFGGKYMTAVSRGKIVRVVERVPLGQNNYLNVVIIDNKPYVISNGEKGAQILMELNEEVVEKYRTKNDFINSPVNLSEFFNNKFRGKIKNEKIR